MATLKAPKQMIAPQVPVDLYRDGRLEKSYASVSECARDLHISYQTAKYLIATGKELYTVPESVTLDIPSFSPYSYVLVRDCDDRGYIPVVKDDRTGELLGV